MAYANILIGDLPNDGTGDPLRVAFAKINNNFANLQTLVDPEGPIGAFQFKSTSNIDGIISNSYSGTSALTFDGSNVTIGTNLIPSTTIVDIGSPANTIQNIYVGNSVKIGGVTLTGSADTINYSATVSAVNLTATNTIRLGTTVLVDSSAFLATTSNNDVDQTLYEIPMSQIKTARFEITSVESSTQNSQYAVIEATKQNNNADVKYVISGTIFVGTVLTHYSVTTAYGQFKFNVSPFANSTITHSIVAKINT
jgi:hypothetical protein